MGLHVKKGKGLIQYFAAFTKGAGAMILAMLKGDTDKVKAISKTVKKQDIIHFLLQLDQATLHLVTGPIHMIDAITGWHIGADLGALTKKSAELALSAIDAITQAFNKILTSLKTAPVNDTVTHKLEKKVSGVHKQVIKTLTPTH